MSISEAAFFLRVVFLPLPASEVWPRFTELVRLSFSPAMSEVLRRFTEVVRCCFAFEDAVPEMDLLRFAAALLADGMHVDGIEPGQQL